MVSSAQTQSKDFVYLNCKLLLKIFCTQLFWIKLIRNISRLFPKKLNRSLRWCIVSTKMLAFWDRSDPNIYFVLKVLHSNKQLYICIQDLYTSYSLLYSYDYFIRFYNLVVFIPFDIKHKNAFARMFFIKISVYALSNSVRLAIIGLVNDNTIPNTLK